MCKSVIGNNIRLFRINKGFTQKQLGEMLEISDVMVGQYERGTRTPKTPMLQKMAKIFGVSVEDFLLDGDKKLNKDTDIGKRIRAIREKRGISQRELGDILGVTQQTIGQLENNKTSPKIETLERVAAALNVPITALIEASTEAQHLKATWEWIQSNDQKRAELIKEILKTHSYKITEKDIHWLIVTDHQGFSFLVSRNDFQDMTERCDKDIRYNIEKLLNESRQYKPDSTS